MSGKKYPWETMRDQKLLELKFLDLKLEIKNSRVEPLIVQLYDELKEKNILFKPHFWIAKEWFSPDGVPGIALPFYVLHPRLARLEKKMVHEAEGYSERDCMRLLRHEAGHAIDNAFGLRKIKRRQTLFGLSSTPYPDYYSPRAYSKKYVVHLNSWYAQSHPDEDWAETFAVWLNPKSNWQKRYKHWPALKKLEMVDEIMAGLKKKRPPNKPKETLENIKTSRQKLKTHYSQKRERFGIGEPFYMDPLLIKLFTVEPPRKSSKRADRFIRQERKVVATMVSRWTGQYRYTIDLILDELIESCREKKLFLRFSERETRMDLVGMLTAHTLNYITEGNHQIPM